MSLNAAVGEATPLKEDDRHATASLYISVVKKPKTFREKYETIEIGSFMRPQMMVESDVAVIGGEEGLQ